MGIENLPLINALDKFAESLPLEHRSALYSFAESFLCVGAMNGVLDSHGAGSDQKELVDYLSKKKQDYAAR